MYVWSLAWHSDTIAVERFNHLAKVLTNSTALLDVHSPPPDFTTASNITNQIYTRTFAIQMSLLAPQLLPAAADIRPVPARRVAPERRVFMSEPLFYLSLTILIVDLIMAIIFYWRIPRPFLPSMPVNIASQIAFFAGSHMMDDVQNAGGDLQDLDRKGYRYGYGRYVGKDGKVHLGIEREPYVAHLAQTRTRLRSRSILGKDDYMRESSGAD